MIEHDQARRFVGEDRSAQHRADGSAGSGDEHPLATQQLPDFGVIDRDLVAVEEVGEFDVPDIGDRHAAPRQRVGRRENLDGEARPLAEVGDGVDVVLGCSRHGKKQRVGFVSECGRFEVGSGSGNMDPVDDEAALGGVVIEERDRVECGLRILEQGSADLGPGFAGPEDQHPVLACMRRMALDLDDEPGEVSNAERTEKLIGAGGKDRAEGYEVGCADQDHKGKRRERGNQCREHDQADLPEGGECSPPPVEAGGKAGGELHGGSDGRNLEQLRDSDLRNVEAESRQDSEKEGAVPEEGIGGRGEGEAPAPERAEPRMLLHVSPRIGAGCVDDTAVARRCHMEMRPSEETVGRGPNRRRFATALDAVAERRVRVLLRATLDETLVRHRVHAAVDTQHGRLIGLALCLGLHEHMLSASRLFQEEP